MSTPPPSLVLFDLFVNILAHNLAEPAYQAQVAQLEYKLVAAEHGLLLRLKGFNHKLPVDTYTHLSVFKFKL
jgi:nardilysin